MQLRKPVLVVIVFLSALLWSNIGNASLVYEYRLFVSNFVGDDSHITYTSVPQMLSTSGAQASATSNSLSAYAGNWYYAPNDMWVGSNAVAELKVSSDSLIRLDFSFDYVLNESSLPSNSAASANAAFSYYGSGGTNIFHDYVYYNSTEPKTGSYTGFVELGAGGYLTIWTSAIIGNQDSGSFFSGNISNINITSSPVPIPGSVFLLASGIVGLVGIKRRYRNKRVERDLNL
jgi:hypothetical protein